MFFFVQLDGQLPPDHVRERVLATTEAPCRSQQHRRKGGPRAQHIPDQHLEVPGEILHASDRQLEVPVEIVEAFLPSFACEVPK